MDLDIRPPDQVWVSDITYAGLQQEVDAQPGFDTYDQIAPPGLFEVASLRLVNAQFTTLRSALAAEFRPEGQEGYIFDLLLTVSEDAPVMLQVEGLGAFAEYEVHLVDRHLSKFYDLRGQETLTLRSSRQQSRYSLVVGSPAFIEETEERSIPETFTLLPNYPNPFNPSTVIEYALPESISGWDVWLEVYNVLGQRVRVLVEGREEAGFYRVEWDGTDEAGMQVASGAYLYRLQVGSFSQVRHMLLLK